MEEHMKKEIIRGLEIKLDYFLEEIRIRKPDMGESSRIKKELERKHHSESGYTALKQSLNGYRDNNDARYERIRKDIINSLKNENYVMEDLGNNYWLEKFLEYVDEYEKEYEEYRVEEFLGGILTRSLEVKGRTFYKGTKVDKITETRRPTQKDGTWFASTVHVYVENEKFELPDKTIKYSKLFE